MSKFKLVSAVSVIGAAVLVLAGCAATPSATSTSSVGVDAKAAAALPAQYKAKGLNVGSEIPYAPMEFYDANQKPIGFEVDLLTAIAGKLGTTVTFHNQAFDTIIASLQSGKHDLAVSSMSDTTDRQAVLNFVDYFQGGASLIVPAGNPGKVTGLAGLCGTSVTTESASWEVDILASASKTCTDAGNKPITTLALPSDVDCQNAVRAGRAVGYLSDSQAAAYTAKVAGGGKYFELVVDPTAPNGYESGLLGVGILKTNTGLTKAIQLATQSLIDDGSYAKLLTKWNLESFAVPSATVNGTK